MQTSRDTSAKVQIPQRSQSMNPQGTNIMQTSRDTSAKVQIPQRSQSTNIIPPKHKPCSPTKYKFHKVQISCRRHVRRDTASPTTSRTLLHCVKRKMEPAYRNKHTPYGPYNLPHMVLCTKQGPDNA